MCLVAGLLIAVPQLPFIKDSSAEARERAEAAVEVLNDGDLLELDNHLEAHNGDRDFAYFFTAGATPRALGDALSAMTGDGAGGTLKEGVDALEYELALTDLAGTLALATYGTGERALPASWTEDFIEATTTPDTLYVDQTIERAAQDAANKQNLLLLLSRGYWSTAFLEPLTAAYWDHDREKGSEAWASPIVDGARYAPSPTGSFLTDGMLALTAALTANPAASKWAYSDFRPGTRRIDGSDHEIGEFAHYLLFEHRFPEAKDGSSVGMTAVLTSLSSAIDAAGGASADENGPMRDSRVLQELATKMAEGNGCSWNPLDYLSCAKAAAAAVLGWIKKWGHLVLDILSLATFFPPIAGLGMAAATGNAVWYAIEGDFGKAGLSLAAALPGLAFSKIARRVTAADLAKYSVGVLAQLERFAPRTAAVAASARPAQLAAKKAKAQELSVAGASQVRKARSAGYPLEREAQDHLAKKIKGSVTEKKVDPGCTTTCAGGRRVDIYDARKRRCIEVKKGVGATNFRHETSQVFKDVKLRHRRICSVEWHFFPDAEGAVGPHERLRKLLRQKRIPYVMWLPRRF